MPSRSYQKRLFNAVNEVLERTNAVIESSSLAISTGDDAVTLVHEFVKGAPLDLGEARARCETANEAVARHRTAVAEYGKACEMLNRIMSTRLDGNAEDTE